MDQVKIGKFLAELRKREGLTQAEAGEKLGVTNKTVSRWETGTYMPDIEMLQLFGKLYNVSINEILSGEFLDDTAFREKADENIIKAVESNTFGIHEKMKFFKNKWLKEHTLLFVLLGIVFVGLLFAAYFFLGEWRSVGGSAVLLAAVCAYGYLRNKMMIYVENHVYGNKE